MATAAAMRQLSRQLESVPDLAVAELVRWFVPRSEEVGGKIVWFGKVEQLSSKLRNPRKRERTTRVKLVGTPAGAWSIKSYGRRGDYDITPRRAQALNLGDVVPGLSEFIQKVHIDRATSGDDRWQRLVNEADDRFPDVVAELVDRSTR